ncbi:hypothetical protein VCRA2122O339_230056 [Vibrio crassostreae]|nr:hypothetical protein VCRA2127O345_10233 [Vibrio crassostreae]CAK3340029.1 hypothetical protein VCRA2122O338_10233 [Vibrio crassostreae]CAK3373592.1 hypothetical protein VCRA2122O339_230056 [Vibrio crassostreae]
MLSTPPRLSDLTPVNTILYKFYSLLIPLNLVKGGGSQTCHPLLILAPLKRIRGNPKPLYLTSAITAFGCRKRAKI